MRYFTPGTGDIVTSSIDPSLSDTPVILDVSVIPYPFKMYLIPNLFAFSRYFFIWAGVTASPPINTYFTCSKELSAKPLSSNVAIWLGATKAIFALVSARSFPNAKRSYLGW